jgi:hypothetical protein
MFTLSPTIDPFNPLSTAAIARKISLLKEASPFKVMSCALIALTDRQKDIDATKEVIGGAGAPSTKMVSRPANAPGRPAVFCGQLVPRDEGRSPPARQGSPYSRGHGTHPTRALSSHPTIGKEHRSITPTHPTTGILSQLVVPLSSSDDDLPLVKHDTRVDLNPSGIRIRNTQEPALMSDSPPSSSPPYIMSGQWVGVGRGKVLIPNPEYKGKGRTESASSNLTLGVQRRRPPPKIRSPPRTMEFTDDDMEEEKEELFDELMASLKQKITALEEQVIEAPSGL